MKTRAELEALADRAADEHGIDRNVFRSQIQQESGWNPNARSVAGAQGLLQIMPGTQKELGITNPYDPEQSIRGGARYLATQLKTFGGDYGLALKAYNAGPGNVKKYGHNVPFAETQNYSKSILSRANYGQTQNTEDIAAARALLQTQGDSTTPDFQTVANHGGPQTPQAPEPLDPDMFAASIFLQKQEEAEEKIKRQQDKDYTDLSMALKIPKNLNKLKALPLEDRQQILQEWASGQYANYWRNASKSPDQRKADMEEAAKLLTPEAFSQGNGAGDFMASLGLGLAEAGSPVVNILEAGINAINPFQDIDIGGIDAQNRAGLQWAANSKSGAGQAGLLLGGGLGAAGLGIATAAGIAATGATAGAAAGLASLGVPAVLTEALMGGLPMAALTNTNQVLGGASLDQGGLGFLADSALNAIPGGNTLSLGKRLALGAGTGSLSEIISSAIYQQPLELQNLAAGAAMGAAFGAYPSARDLSTTPKEATVSALSQKVTTPTLPLSELAYTQKASTLKRIKELGIPLSETQQRDLSRVEAYEADNGNTIRSLGERAAGDPKAIQKLNADYSKLKTDPKAPQWKLEAYKDAVSLANRQSDDMLQAQISQERLSQPPDVLTTASDPEMVARIAQIPEMQRTRDQQSALELSRKPEALAELHELSAQLETALGSPESTKLLSDKLSQAFMVEGANSPKVQELFSLYKAASLAQTVSDSMQASVIRAKGLPAIQAAEAADIKANGFQSALEAPKYRSYLETQAQASPSKSIQKESLSVLKDLERYDSIQQLSQLEAQPSSLLYDSQMLKLATEGKQFLTTKGLEVPSSIERMAAISNAGPSIRKAIEKPNPYLELKKISENELASADTSMTAKLLMEEIRQAKSQKQAAEAQQAESQFQQKVQALELAAQDPARVAQATALVQQAKASTSFTENIANLDPSIRDAIIITKKAEEAARQLAIEEAEAKKLAAEASLAKDTESLLAQMADPNLPAKTLTKVQGRLTTIQASPKTPDSLKQLIGEALQEKATPVIKNLKAAFTQRLMPEDAGYQAPENSASTAALGYPQTIETLLGRAGKKAQQDFRRVPDEVKATIKTLETAITKNQMVRMSYDSKTGIDSSGDSIVFDGASGNKMLYPVGFDYNPNASDELSKWSLRAFNNNGDLHTYHVGRGEQAIPLDTVKAPNLVEVPAKEAFYHLLENDPAIVLGVMKAQSPSDYLEDVFSALQDTAFAHPVYTNHVLSRAFGEQRNQVAIDMLDQYGLHYMVDGTPADVAATLFNELPAGIQAFLKHVVC